MSEASSSALVPVPATRLMAFFGSLRVEGECWVWTAGVQTNGYPVFHPEQSLTHRAHRVSYRWFRGELAVDAEVDHLCNNKLCVNPAHLQACTRDEHQTRHRELRESVCRKGHLITGDNAHFSKSRNSVSRQCAICHRERERARQRRLRAASVSHAGSVRP